MSSLDRLLFETHSHTPLCKHAVGLPGDYAAQAWLRGLRGLLVTCHNPMPDGFSAHVRMDESEFDEYCELVADARQQWEGRVDVRLGLECDFFPGHESYVERQTQWADFHYLLGSVHPQVREFRRRFGCGTPREYQEAYFEQLALAAESRLFDCLSHPDLIKNMTSDDWDVAELLEPVILPALDRIAAVGVSMELNTSGVNKTISEMNPCGPMLRAMREREIPVVIGADAHSPDRVGDGFADALDLLEECGYERTGFFLERRRHEVEIAAARASLSASPQPD